MESYAFKGVTTNPTLMAKEKRTDYLHHFKDIQKGLKGNPLFIQLNGETASNMVSEAHYVSTYLKEGPLVFKIPATKEGFHAMQTLSKRYAVAATAVSSLPQALMAYNAGASTMIIYINRMLSNGLSPYHLIIDLIELKSLHGYHFNVMGASFKSSEEVLKAIQSGINSVTINPDLASTLFLSPLSEKSVKAFQKDFEARYQVTSFKDE